MKFGYVNGDGSSPTEVSLAVFHRMLGDVGLSRQFSLLPFELWNPDSRDGMLDVALDAKSLSSAKQKLELQAKELLRYLMFDDGYKDCIDFSDNSGNSEAKELKKLKLQHLIRIANYRGAWLVKVPPRNPDALPTQKTGGDVHDTVTRDDSVGVNANRVISVCRLLSLRPDDIEGDAVSFLREGLYTAASDASPESAFFRVEKHGDALEFRAMMCVVRLCNVALGRYSGYEKAEPEVVGSSEWNAWYIITGEIRALRILQQTAASEANKVKRQLSKTGMASGEAMAMRDGACPLDYSLPLLNEL